MNVQPQFVDQSQRYIAYALESDFASVRVRRPVPASSAVDHLQLVTHNKTPRPSDQSSVSGGRIQVRTINDRNRTISGPAEIVEAARSAAKGIVEIEERRTLSRMVAYQNAASMVGVSSSWLRKFVNGYPDAKPDLVAGFNILMQYARLTTGKNSGS